MKGAINLGVKTIVILIIAIVLLGLGTAFVMNIFNKAESLPELIDPSQLTNPPTALNPVVVHPTTITTEYGEPAMVTAGVYNKESTATYFRFLGGDCAKDGQEYGYRVNSVPGEVRASESLGFKILIEPRQKDTWFEPGEYVCSLYADEVEASGGQQVGKEYIQYTTQFNLRVQE